MSAVVRGDREPRDTTRNLEYDPEKPALGLDHGKSDVSDLRPFKVPELGNTRVLVVHLLRIKVFRVKPGNDGGD